MLHNNFAGVDMDSLQLFDDGSSILTEPPVHHPLPPRSVPVGPFLYGYDYDGLDGECVYQEAPDDGSEWVATCATQDIAELFAASPDLYAALRAIVDAREEWWERKTQKEGELGDDDSPLWPAAYAALSKARGEAPAPTTTENSEAAV